jgi:hypothetical protein
MINAACNHLKSNNRFEGECHEGGIQAIPTLVQCSNTLDAHGSYQGGHPSVALRGEKIKTHEVMQQ